MDRERRITLWLLLLLVRESSRIPARFVHSRTPHWVAVTRGQRMRDSSPGLDREWVALDIHPMMNFVAR